MKLMGIVWIFMHPIHPIDSFIKQEWHICSLQNKDFMIFYCSWIFQILFFKPLSNIHICYFQPDMFCFQCMIFFFFKTHTKKTPTKKPHFLRFHTHTHTCKCTYTHARTHAHPRMRTHTHINCRCAF